MKASHILLFILSILLILGVISWSFPDDGITVKIRFPSRAAISESLFPKDTIVPVLSPEELLALHEKEVQRHKNEDMFSEYLQNSPNRFYFPENDSTALDRFFMALDSACVHHVRIAHYGDSQLEEDRITYTYRQKLQSRFGGGGAGMIPLMLLHASLSMRQTRSDTLRRSMVYGRQYFSVSHGKYGPMGQATRLYSRFSATFFPTKWKDNSNPSRYFNKVTVLSDFSESPLVISSKNGSQSVIKKSASLRRTSFHFPDSTYSTSLYFKGRCDVYGVLFDNETGVSVDNIAMRGCTGTIFTAMNSEQLHDYFTNDNVALIILQFGGNPIPYRKTGKSISDYSQTIFKQIIHLKSLAPDACFIFIGPSDMARYSNGAVKSYPNLQMMVDSLKHYSNKAGAVYWDLRQVMGGEGSMNKWVKTGFAGSDYIHFTQKGADYVGNVFYDNMMVYYDRYKWLQNQNK